MADEIKSPEKDEQHAAQNPEDQSAQGYEQKPDPAGAPSAGGVKPQAPGGAAGYGEMGPGGFGTMASGATAKATLSNVINNYQAELGGMEKPFPEVPDGALESAQQFALIPPQDTGGGTRTIPPIPPTSGITQPPTTLKMATGKGEPAQKASPSFAGRQAAQPGSAGGKVMQPGELPPKPSAQGAFGSIRPPLTPQQASEKYGPGQAMEFGKPVRVTMPDREQVHYPVGTHEVPDKVAQHPYIKASGAKPPEQAQPRSPQPIQPGKADKTAPPKDKK